MEIAPESGLGTTFLGNLMASHPSFLVLPSGGVPTTVVPRRMDMPHTILVVDDEPDLELLVNQRFKREIRDRTSPNSQVVFIVGRPAPSRKALS